MMAALLECRNAVGLEPCIQLNNAASWRLSFFKQTEDIIRLKMAANLQAPEQAAEVASLVEDDIDLLLQQNPFQASPDDLAKLEAEISSRIMLACTMMSKVMSTEQMGKLKDKAMQLFGSRDMLHDVLNTERGRAGLVSFLVDQLPTFCTTEPSQPESSQPGRSA